MRSRKSLGELVGGGFAPERLLDGLGHEWQITRNYFRLYACCNPIHPALDCLAAALAELNPRPSEVARIDFATYRFASVMRNPDPPNYFASKYSLPHAAAAMVVRGGAGFAQLDDSALADPKIAALRHKVHIEEDPAMSALAPQAAAGAGHRDPGRRPQPRRMRSRATVATSTLRSPKPRCGASSASSPTWS